ncbi:bifunctional diaminohydroxyphosphoribosylaminopyrimidine deaminase/5-amino-6-(5-phosphoribosylamino)uracil reductase RibD [Desulfogranum mediterraneum]|uniref:bifunctional diaminohydroxyphosphoribosylaminopyrimidine deaminase/5-amino-6-(5-phosphoribosylamino)uracil reductase RibD n=1 Tax=Desulfogranum mediterraneum TaxID=160661 RepID=UPI00040EECE0|nr:bifunctional diaminohydroxyphosphoribosylaminopyrimidine deaminase/5-amino-6-(5-phosphoribosylamino)uracil reductase RibD [Desulfogranum mediterraneum]
MSSFDDDQRFMEIALAEARKGLGRTSPNPAVGAVVVREGRIVGRGYHRKAGTPHAEVHALADASASARGATIYVTLEPCNHTGRTPPCTQAILKSGIARVVIGMLDPNPHVAGKGMECLEQAGLTVCHGILEKECRALNYPFLKHIATGLPWVIMKAGLSLDGRISYRKGEGGKITGPASGERVHQIRDRVDAILIGVGTALSDDPSLTTRLGTGKGQDPLRIIVDTSLRLPPAARMLHQDSEAETWVYCGTAASEERQQQLEAAGARVVRLPLYPDGGLDLNALLAHLGEEGINALLVEGGSRIHGSFLQADLVDQVCLFYAPFFIGDQGTPLLKGYGINQREAGAGFVETSITALGSDLLFTGYRHFPA